jgi:membrane-associated phospholipid phosphatase
MRPLQRMWARTVRPLAARLRERGAPGIRIYTRRPLRPARLHGKRTSAGLRLGVRAAAVAGIAASVAVPLLRKRLRIPAAATVAATVAGPVGTAILFPRTKTRDAVLFGQQMWAFTVVHEIPYDDPDRLRARLKVKYPIAADRVIGAGKLPNARLQRRFAKPEGTTGLDRFLSFAHWAWFLEPHASLLFILTRDNPKFARAARQMAAAYDLGCAGYFAVPTAPPWWAAENGYMGDEKVERLMERVGQEVWGDVWPHLYKTFGGNPWAAMPSLHFGASVLSAMLLSESSRTAGAVGWAYAGVLGFALVHLGEHYVLDLLAGLGLVMAVRQGEPVAEPLALAFSEGIQKLERIANS